uniref:Probable serine/threonine-protein kinase DDB_G0282963 n=1 Tax=Dermatophagoides pteronyssinus TaxID=6956 RepID=A0A6P6Y932_DERPT|nr:probable serine/threonine-protein kinase DDB_G0282963 [Dermatophagoides pteronyssinus]
MEQRNNHIIMTSSTTKTTTTNQSTLRLHTNPIMMGTLGHSHNHIAAAYHHSYNHHPHHQQHFNTVRVARLNRIHGHSYHGQQQQQQLQLIQQQQQPPPSSSTSKSSPLNGLFTWKRKSSTKTTSTISNRHAPNNSIIPNATSQSKAATKAAIPPSLAKLFNRDVAGNTSLTDNMNHCVCRGLTGSTFMAPSYHHYFDDDDSQLIAPCSNVSKQQNIRSISNDSLLVDCGQRSSQQQQQQFNTTQTKRHSAKTMGKPFHTINERRRLVSNVSKSLDRIVAASQQSSTSSSATNSQQKQTENRRSILECNVNPYELVLTNNDDSNQQSSLSDTTTVKIAKRTNNKIKYKADTVKSSHSMSWINKQNNSKDDDSKMNQTFDTTAISSCLDCKDQKSKNRMIVRNLFNKTNSIRIAGQTVYSAIQFAATVDDDRTHPHHHQAINLKLPPLTSTTNPLQRTRSSGSLSSSWSFDDSTSQSNSDSSLNRSTTTTRQIVVDQRISPLIIDEPEPDYDDQDENNGQINLENHQQKESTEILTNDDDKKINFERKKSPSTSSLQRPKNIPPPCPPPALPPPPPPPPPPEFLTTPSTSLSTTNRSTTTTLPKNPMKNENPTNEKQSNNRQQDNNNRSFENELKERLNQGVKSILKKTNFSSSSLNEIVSVVHKNNNVDDNININNDDVMEDSSSLKGKKHVHFRMKRSSAASVSLSDVSGTVSSGGSGSLNRSRSASHIITEIIHEEDLDNNDGGEHCGNSSSSYYDDVSRSPDDLMMADFGDNNSNDGCCLIQNQNENHRQQLSSTTISPLPPPVPARRYQQQIPDDNDVEDNEKSSSTTGKQPLTKFYSTGSVRSLLAKKLNLSYSPATIKRSPNHSLGRRLNFSINQNVDADDDDDINLNNQSINDDDHILNIDESDLITKSDDNCHNEPTMINNNRNTEIDDHIYEELDYCYIDSKEISMAKNDANKTTKHRLFMGTHRDEILNYLNGARQRFVVDTNCMDKLDFDSNCNIGQSSSSSTSINNNNNNNNNNNQIISEDIESKYQMENDDSGNSSLICMADDQYQESLVYLIKKKSCFINANNNNNNNNNDSSSITGSTMASTRRNRVSNISNASSESSATSGVSISNLTMDEMDDDDDDAITTSSSSIGGGSSANSSGYYVLANRIIPTVERNDSGVGNEIDCRTMANKDDDDHDRICLDCERHEDMVSNNRLPITSLNNGSKQQEQHYYHSFNYVCHPCQKRRNERKEIISEIVDTELKYGRDLKIILEEFAKPISVAGLLTQQQVDDIFLNLDQLIDVNCQLAQLLQDAVDLAIEQQGDEDLTTVNIGQLFNECLLEKIAVFERYCIRQASASLLLNQLEKEKELLRIFLRVSQMENALLRRMNLRSFLVVPVQRITKYPLLLNRLVKVTPRHYADYDSLRETQMKLEYHLDNINQKTKGSIAATTSRIWRRISNLSSSASMRIRNNDSQHHHHVIEDFGHVRLKKTSLDLLKWPQDESRFIMIGRLSFIVERSGTATSSEQLNASYNNNGGSSSINNNIMSNSTHTILHNSLSNSSSISSSSKIWSRTLKFSIAHAVLIVRSSNVSDSETINMDTSITQTSSLLLSDIANINHSSLSNVDCSESNDFLLRSSSNVRQRSNSKSPIRINNGSSCNSLSLSQQQQQQYPGNKSKINGDREAMLILFKEKNGRYTLCRDVLNLSMCVIAKATDFDSEEFFEIHELESRESLLLKAETQSEMREWLEQLRKQSQCLGQWRRRRNALPNIMVLRQMDNDINHDNDDDVDDNNSTNQNHERYPTITINS